MLLPTVLQVLQLSGLSPATVDLSVTSCPALNISQCLVGAGHVVHQALLCAELRPQVSETAETFIVSVYNPMSWPINPYIRCQTPSPLSSMIKLCKTCKKSRPGRPPVEGNFQELGKFSGNF